MSSRPAEEDQEVQLGRNLAAAFIATCHGIGLDYARKKYAGQPVGQYWIALARMVTTDMSKSAIEPERISTLQLGRGAGSRTEAYSPASDNRVTTSVICGGFRAGRTAPTERRCKYVDISL